MPDRLAAWVALHSVPDMGPVTFRRVLDRFGTVERALEQASPETLAGIARMEPDLALHIQQAGARVEWVERQIESLAGHGVNVVRRCDTAVPPVLKDLRNPPPLLYVAGEIQAPDSRAVGIVGSTRPTARARDIAGALGEKLAGAGVTVVSGYAEGIDEAAHLGALRGAGRTILCLPFGIRRLKLRPGWPGLAELKKRGAALSEQPPDTDWQTQAALARNRLIAALGRALIVVETTADGGAMNTVQWARELGRPVFAVAYQNPPEQARGNALCLARGAVALERLRDVEKVLAVVGVCA